MNNPIDTQGKDTRHPNPIGSPIEETATDARQGRKGTPMLKVLVAGLLLAAVAWGAAEWWGEASDPPASETATPPAGETQPRNSGTDPATGPSVPATEPQTPPASTPPASGGQGNNP